MTKVFDCSSILDQLTLAHNEDFPIGIIKLHEIIFCRVIIYIISSY